MAQPGDGNYIPQHEAADIEWGEWGHDHPKTRPSTFQYQCIGGRSQWRYPVKRDPKVETVVLLGSVASMWGRHKSTGDTHRVTLTIVDGKPTSFGPVEEL